MAQPHSRSSAERFSPLKKPVHDDAWSSIFKPPPNETVEEKRERLARQQEAQRVSREIDEGILESKKALEKKKKAVKVLLLGTHITTILV
jgi:guanine nucleotide-binding protein subunit alpha